jgi:hypothetical protein
MNDFVHNKCVTIDSGVMVRDNRILIGQVLGNFMLPVIGKYGTTTQVTFTYVLYVPLLNTKLVSERLLWSKKVFYSSEEFALYNRDSHGKARYFMALQELDGLPYLWLADNYKHWPVDHLSYLSHAELDLPHQNDVLLISAPAPAWQCGLLGSATA